MEHQIALGTKNKITGEYVYPRIATKNEEYLCPDCDKDLILGVFTFITFILMILKL